MKKRIFKLIKAIFKIIKLSLFLLIIASLSRCTYNHIKFERLRSSMLDVETYFIINKDKYEKEFEKMGYKVVEDYDLVFYRTNSDKENITFYYNAGLNKIEKRFNQDTFVEICKADQTDHTPLYYDDNKYHISVKLSAPEYTGKHEYSPFNDYKTNFEDFRIIWDGEMDDDYRIKKYISAQELRDLLNEGKELEEKLVQLYNERDKD